MVLRTSDEIVSVRVVASCVENEKGSVVEISVDDSVELLNGTLVGSDSEL